MAVALTVVVRPLIAVPAPLLYAAVACAAIAGPRRARRAASVVRERLRRRARATGDLDP